MFSLWFTEQHQPPREPADVLTLFPWEVFHAGLSRPLILPGSVLIGRRSLGDVVTWQQGFMDV